MQKLAIFHISFQWARPGIEQGVFSLSEGGNAGKGPFSLFQRVVTLGQVCFLGPSVCSHPGMHKRRNFYRQKVLDFYYYYARKECAIGFHLPSLPHPLAKRGAASLVKPCDFRINTSKNCLGYLAGLPIETRTWLVANMQKTQGGNMGKWWILYNIGTRLVVSNGYIGKLIIIIILQGREGITCYIGILPLRHMLPSSSVGNNNNS